MSENKISKKEQNERREAIIRSLPGFINQLLLLSDCGMVMSECIIRIGNSYRELPDDRKNYFTESIVKICEDNEENNESIIISFNRLARLSSVKEFARVGNLLMENKNKGTDLWLKLEEQGSNLWEERKRLALSKIRLAETKMSFPLGVLLVSLIIITAAPAFLQMG